MKTYKEDNEYIWLFCPNHDDKKTGNLCVNKIDSDKYPKGFSYCYACGYTTQFSEEAVDKMIGKSRFSSKIKSICRKKIPIDWEKLVRIYCLSDITEQKSWKLATKWKVCSFGYYDVGYDYNNKAITVPMRDEDEKIIVIQRRYPCGGKRCVEGSQLGLFIQW